METAIPPYEVMANNLSRASENKIHDDSVARRFGSAFLLPVRVLGALFRRLFLTRLLDLHGASKLVFFGQMAGLSDHRAFLRQLAPVRRKRWVVYAKAPFAGPEAVLAYLSRKLPDCHRPRICQDRSRAIRVK